MTKNGKRVRILSLVCIMVLFIGFIGFQDEFSVQAAKSAFAIEGGTKKLKLGNTMRLSVTGKSKKDTVYWESSNSGIVSVDTMTGKIEACGLGEATVTATAMVIKEEEDGSESIINVRNSTVKIKVTETKYQFAEKEITMFTEDTLVLKLKTDSSVQETYFEIYENEFNFPYEGAVEIDDSVTGRATVTAIEAGDYTLSAYSVRTVDGKKQQYRADCKLHIKQLGMDDVRSAIAVGAEQKYKLGNCKSDAVWQIEDPAIAAVDLKGKVTGLSVGDTLLSVLVTTNNGEQRTFEKPIVITDPVAPVLPENLYAPDYLTLDFEGIDDYSSTVTLLSGSDKFPVISSGLIELREKGTCRIKANVDGREFSFKFKVWKPSFVEESVILQTGKKVQNSLNGLPDGMKVKYRVADEKIASTSKNGKITANKAGNTLLYAQADGYQWVSGISVSNQAAAVDSVKTAQKAVGKAIYSQDRRMQQGYFDCSSLVWRSYMPEGYKFGDNTYAPTAAGIALYSKQHGQAIAAKAISPEKLQVGDLIFYSSAENGRYLNITHVSMFRGVASYEGLIKIGEYGYGQDDEYGYIGVTVEAGNGGVYNGTYYEGEPSVVMIARPTKKAK